MFAFHILDPLDSLALRIDHERPTRAAMHDYAVLGAEQVGGQALDVPLAHLGRLGQKVGELKVRIARYAESMHLRLPNLLHDLVAVLGQERAHVGEERGREQTIAWQEAHLNLEILDSLFPSNFLARQTRYESVGAVEHHLERLDVFGELVFLYHLLVVLFLQLFDLFLNLVSLKTTKPND